MQQYATSQFHSRVKSDTPAPELQLYSCMQESIDLGMVPQHSSPEDQSLSYPG